LQQARLENDVLKSQIQVLTAERDKAQSVANTVDTVLTASKTAQEQLAGNARQLVLENQRLKNDLGFFEKLIPATGPNTDTLAIRGFQTEVLPSGAIKWQVLLIQGVKNPVEFEGRLELAFSGLSLGKSWSAGPPGGALGIKIKQYGRVEGVYQVPNQTVVKTVTVKAIEGQTVRAQQTIAIN